MMRYFGRVEEAELRDFLAESRAAHPGFGVLAMLPEGEKERVPVLQKACGGLGIPLFGTVFPALVKDDAFVSNGLWLLCFDKMPKAWLYADIPLAPAENEAFVERIAADFSEFLDASPDGEDVTLLMFFDALLPNIGTMLEGLYARLADRVNYLGSNPGSETFMPMPCLFDGAGSVNDGLLALMLPGHRGGILEHGYNVPEKIIHATSTDGNCIANIDWKPAFDVYREFVQSQYGVEVTQGNFYSNAVHFPFGILLANHTVLVRIPVVLRDDGSLLCIGQVPPNSVLTLLRAPEINSAHTVEAIHRGLAGLDPDLAGRDMLLFFCAGRHLHLGDAAAAHELAHFKTVTGARSVAGARSLGEIGPSTLGGGYPLFHNATLVASCI